MSKAKTSPSSPQRDMARCPICAKATTEEAHPFCSPRCQKLDLSRWFSGTYAVPGEAVSPTANDPEEEDI